MSQSGPVIELRMLNELRSFFERHDGRLADVLIEARIDPALLNDLKAVVPLNTFATIFEIAAVRSKDDAFGLHAGFHMVPGASGLLGHIMLSAATVREMLKVAAEYIGVHMRPIEVTFTEAEGVGCIMWTYPASFDAPRIQYTGFSIATVVSRIRRAAGATWMPLAVEYDHREPAAIDEYIRLLGPRLRFDKRSCGIWIDPTALAAPLPEVLPGLLQTVRELGDLKLAEAAADGSVSWQVQAVLRKRLAQREPVSLESVAEALKIGERALQYRLEQVETSYEKLLGEVRRKEAERYLRDTSLSMTEIAELLGFAEPSVFTRAAQKWFDMAPRAYRRKLRGESTGDDGGSA